MTQFEYWMTTDLKRGSSQAQVLHGQTFTQDNLGNRVGVVVLDGGEPATLDGTVTGYVIRADGGTVVQTGAIDGNKAYIDLPESAYAVPGQIQIAIRLTSGSTKTVLGALNAYVQRTATGTIIDPGHVVPDIDDIIAKMDEVDEAIANAETATTSANTAAQNANNATGYIAATEATSTASAYHAKGNYLIYDGKLYQATADIAIGDTLATTGTGANIAQVTGGAMGEVTDLKSAVSSLEDTVDGAKTLLAIDDIDNGYWSTNTYTNTTSWKYGFVDVGTDSVAIVDIKNATNQSVNIQVLDSNKNYVRLIGNWLTQGEYTITLGASEKYLRISAKPAEISNIPVYKRTTVPLQNQIDQLSAKDILIEESLANKVGYSVGTNIFNKNTSNTKQNIDVGTNGKISTLENFDAYYIPVKGNTTIVCNYTYLRFGFCSEMNNLTSMSVGDTLAGWISRSVPGTIGEVISVPASAKYMIVCVQDDRPSTLQVQYGTIVTPYRPYSYGILSEDMIFDQTKRIVGLGYDYLTIQSAVNSAIDGDIIEIMPGIYDEAVTIPGSSGDIHYTTKDLHFIGFNRDECILTHDIGDYYEPPLEIASGFVENITIIGTGTSLADGSNQFAYCAHIDYNSAENKTLQFRNCRFVNTVYPCVGAATRNGFKLSFIDCIFECSSSAAFLMHEQQANNKTNQSIQFENCTFISNASGDGTIHVQESDTYTGNSVTLTFARCIVKNTSTGPLAKLYIIGQTEGERTGWLDSKIYHLSTGSALNNSTIFDN